MSWYDSFFGSDWRLEQEIDDLTHSYDIKRLETRIEWATNDIKSLQEAIARCQRLISELHYHKELVETISYKYQVYLCRQSYSKIKYFAGVYKIPSVPNGEKYKVTVDSESKKFDGKERHLAKKYAEELAKKYKCEVIYK